MIIKMSPQRRVTNNVVISHGMPSIQIKVDASLKYLGDLKFTLMEISAVEMFLFAEVQKQQINRLFLVQFEGYLPDTNFTYEYPNLESVQLGDHRYLTDGGVIKLDLVQKRRPEGDIAHWVTWLKRQGFEYALWNELIYRRFVRVLDRANKNEILMLYFENLRNLGYKADDLLKDGMFVHKTPELQSQLYERALKGFTIVQG